MYIHIYVRCYAGPPPKKKNKYIYIYTYVYMRTYDDEWLFELAARSTVWGPLWLLFHAELAALVLPS